MSRSRRRQRGPCGHLLWTRAPALNALTVPTASKRGAVALAGCMVDAARAPMTRDNGPPTAGRTRGTTGWAVRALDAGDGFACHAPPNKGPTHSGSSFAAIAQLLPPHRRTARQVGPFATIAPPAQPSRRPWLVPHSLPTGSLGAGFGSVDSLLADLEEEEQQVGTRWPAHAAGRHAAACRGSAQRGQSLPATRAGQPCAIQGTAPS